jgi:sugar O-acyltransferase (sialic acid O-acetyltransferase NeuD family)
MKNSLILIGGGGHCKSVIDVIESSGHFSIKGIIDNNLKGDVLGYPILGNDADLEKIDFMAKYACISIGQIKSPNLRIKLFNYLQNLNYELPAIVASSARVSKFATLAPGVIVMHGATIVAGSKISTNTIINNHVLVDHDCIIGSNCHISTGATLNGNVVVGENCFIGSGAIVREGVRIGPGSFIAMDSAVSTDISPNTIVKI